MSEPFLGEIRMAGFNFAPQGWAFCNGQIMAINQNQALFSLLGTTFGGDGQTTFALPNLQSRVPIHQGQGVGLSPYVMGENAGTESVTLTQSQMPQHSHTVNANTGGGQATPSGNFPGNEATPVKIYAVASNTTMNAATLSNAGGNQAHSNLQPVLCVNFIIALQGIFPSRS
jgi:microcystin-dependent protein